MKLECAPVHQWVAEPVSRDIKRATQRIASAEDVVSVAIMPDVHLSRDVCVGSVVATTRLVYPAAIGGDIGCGIVAAAFASDAEPLADESIAMRILRMLAETIPVIRHGRERRCPALPHKMASAEFSRSSLYSVLRRDGAVEFGTLGRGNHFLELQADEQDRLWIMIHSGSRAMGPAIQEAHLRGERAGRLIGLDTSEHRGAAYLHDMELARQYAAENRRSMLLGAADVLDRILGCKLDDSSIIDCDHNHVVRQSICSRLLYVHRKGANRAGHDDPGLIPGSMATVSYHSSGRGEALSLNSSSHGAGRSLSRSDARKRFTRSELLRQMRGIWFDARIADDLRAEAPAAYKDVRKVMRAQRDLTRIVRRLRPVLSYKGT